MVTTITIRATEEQKDFLKRIAKFNGTTLSDFVMSSALVKAEEQADYQEYLQWIAQENNKDNLSLEEMGKIFEI